MDPIKFLNENDAVRHLASAVHVVLILGLLKNKRTCWEAATFDKIYETFIWLSNILLCEHSCSSKNFSTSCRVRLKTASY